MDLILWYAMVNRHYDMLSKGPVPQIIVYSILHTWTPVPLYHIIFLRKFVVLVVIISGLETIL